MHTPSPQAVLQRLLQLVERLYAETDGLVESESELQLWYNRGYANGMLKVLRAQGHADLLQGRLTADPEDRMRGQAFLPWGKAYWHGFEKGEAECNAVIGPQT